MAVFLYNLFLILFRAITHFASIFDTKAKKWVQGRKNIFPRLQEAISGKGPVIWMHCASLGEFEQGKTVIESLRKDYPHYRILVTFFSPSGFEAARNYTQADWIFYLPMDGARNAKRFLEIVQPRLVIFVKYEFWYYYLKKMKYREIPLLLVSALFSKKMAFFKWYGGLQRKMLSRFDHIFVQTTESKTLVENLGLDATVSGDTRFDRVAEIASRWEEVPYIRQFTGSHKTLVAGSTWPDDELVLQRAFRSLDQPVSLIIAPHEISEKRIAELKKLFPEALTYSSLPQQVDSRVLIIDNIGMLSRLYRYGYLNYVGGGLQASGVHNVLEAAVYGKVVLWGPVYQKYQEAVDLLLSGGGLSFADPKKNGIVLKDLIAALLADEREYDYRSEAAKQFVRNHQGATKKILDYIQEKRLLTS